MFPNSYPSFYYCIPAVLYAAFIFLLSHQSSPPGAQTLPDYAAHFIEYALFGVTLTWGATSGFRQPLTSKSVLLVVGITLLYAIGDEFHQSFVPDREPSLGDVTMDVLGAATCVGVVWIAGKGKWR